MRFRSFRGRKWFYGILSLLFLVSLFGGGVWQAQGRAFGDENAIQKIYLPLVVKPEPIKIMLGAYPQLWTGSQANLNQEFHAIDAWAGKGLSIVGTFLDIEAGSPAINVGENLALIWDNGYTPFVNLMTTHSAASIAAGSYDTALTAWAQAYRTFATTGGGRMAFIAPLPEMNIPWSYYYDGGNKDNYKAAYAHIRQVFSAQGVPANSVRWVFAPNAYADPGDEFEHYYPGDSSVDVIAFSAYNFGYSSYACGQGSPDWQDPVEVYNNPYLGAPWQGLYLDRMHAMAPSKPFFISQTGTTAYSACGTQNRAKKDQWLRDAYAYLADHGVKAVLYFNLVNYQDVDWPFYDLNAPGNAYQGYKDAIANSKYQYISPAELKTIDLAP